jgi:hypothetical protein
MSVVLKVAADPGLRRKSEERQIIWSEIQTAKPLRDDDNRRRNYDIAAVCRPRADYRRTRRRGHNEAERHRSGLEERHVPTPGETVIGVRHRSAGIETAGGVKAR